MSFEVKDHLWKEHHFWELEIGGKVLQLIRDEKTMKWFLKYKNKKGTWKTLKKRFSSSAEGKIYCEKKLGLDA